MDQNDRPRAVNALHQAIAEKKEELVKLRRLDRLALAAKSFMQSKSK